jgi:hypothetical protein
MTDPKRPRGRPPLDTNDRTVPVSIGLPSKQYADLCREAQHDATTVPELIRRALRDRPKAAS